jgi:hypothetical protein
MFDFIKYISWREFPVLFAAAFMGAAIIFESRARCHLKPDVKYSIIKTIWFGRRPPMNDLTDEGKRLMKISTFLALVAFLMIVLFFFSS